MSIRRNSMVLIVIAAVMLLAACGQVPANAAMPTSSSNSAAQATQPAAAAATQPAPALSPDQVIQTVQKAWKTMETAGPRHVSQVSDKGGATMSTIEADSVPPNLHQVVTVNGQMMAEQYIMDGTIYVYTGGKWIKTVGGSSADALNLLGGMASGISDQIVYADGKVLGIETIHGQPATVYSYSTTLKGLNAPGTQFKVWVDNATGLVVHQEITHPDGLHVVQDITFKPGLTISLPADAAAAAPAQ
jgi:hypothetical protein